MKYTTIFLILAVLLLTGCPTPPADTGLKLNTKLTTLAEQTGTLGATRGSSRTAGVVDSMDITNLTVAVYDYQNGAYTTPVKTTMSSVSLLNGSHLDVSDLEFPEEFLTTNDRLDLDILEVNLNGVGLSSDGTTGYGANYLIYGGVEITNIYGNVPILFVRPDWCPAPMIVRLDNMTTPNNELWVIDPSIKGTGDYVNLTDAKYDFLRAYAAPLINVNEVVVVIPLPNLYRIAWKDTSINDTTLPAVSGFEIGTTAVSILTNPHAIIQLDLKFDLFEFHAGEVKVKSEINQDGFETPLGVIAKISNDGEPVIPTPTPTTVVSPSPSPTATPTL
jgi:hypothetical protein